MKPYPYILSPMLLSLVFASKLAAADTPQVHIHGSNTIGAELMPALIEHYGQTQTWNTERRVANNETSTFVFQNAQQQPTLNVGLQAKGSSTAFKGLLNGSAHIGMASRPIKDKEAAKLQAAGLGDLHDFGHERVLALDGLAIITHAENPVQTISMQSLAKVFSGKITNWQTLGGQDLAINVYARDHQSGTFDTFKSLVLKPSKSSLTPNAKRFSSNEKLSDSVARDPQGVGFTGFAYIRNAKAIELEGSCGMRFSPDEFSVKTEEYPLARRLFLYTIPGSATASAQSLLDYSLSDAAQRIISDTGFVNQDIQLKSGEQGKRLHANLFHPIQNQTLLRDLSSKMADADRASVIFQFNHGSSQLDNKSLQDISRLARFLKRPEHVGKSVKLFGFADSSGDFNTNQRLSLKRAQVVATALEAKGIKAASVTGYSELSPIACNTGKGLDKNRRVEVWLK